MLSGAALAFARALGEYGSLVLFTSGLPFKTRSPRSGSSGSSSPTTTRRPLQLSLVLLVFSLAVLLATRRVAPAPLA